MFSHEPKLVPGHAKYRETIDIGNYSGTIRDYERILDELKEEFPGNSYNILTKNCNHFANALIMKLFNKPIPGYVNRLANLGGMVSCLFPPQLLSDAPVDQQQSSSSSSSSNSGYQVIVPKNREHLLKKSEPTLQANSSTTNSGFILGGSEDNISSATTTTSVDMNSSQLGMHVRAHLSHFILVVFSLILLVGTKRKSTTCCIEKNVKE